MQSLTMRSYKRQLLRLYLPALLISVLAGMLRMETVTRLPPDYDELVYLPVAFRYEEMLAGGKLHQIVNYRENSEHPPMNKLLFAIDLLIRQPREPEWERLEVGKPLPESDRAAFFGPRRISAVGGTLQVFITALIHPLAGLLLALNTYHIKYSAQVYLEGIPGLMAILSVFLFEKSCPPKKQDSYDRWPSWSLLVLSAASLGFAAAGKYLYALVGFVILAFLISRSRSFRRVIIYCFVALAVFLLADPFLWPNPAQRLWESLTFHWRFAHSDHVVASAMPWYSPFVHLLRSAPTKWHPGVFYTGLPDLLVFPLSFFGIRTALRERPIWLTWAAFGLFVLLLWPTKWPQYILVVLPPLAVCAGLGIQQILAAAFRKLAHGS